MTGTAESSFAEVYLSLKEVYLPFIYLVKLDNHLSQAEKTRTFIFIKHAVQEIVNSLCLRAGPVRKSLVSRILTSAKYSGNFLQNNQVVENFHLNIGFTDGTSFKIKNRVKTLMFSFHTSIFFS